MTRICIYTVAGLHALSAEMACKIMYRMRRFFYYVSMVFSKDIFGAIYIEYTKGFVPIRYRGYCLCISPHLILIYLQARVFQHGLVVPSWLALC
jgi:hypothetical protein